MLRIVNHSTAIAMQVKSNAEFYLRYVLSTDSQYNCHDWIFGSKLSMFRIIIYTCTKESTGRSPVAQQWVILWTSAASGPIGWNWRQCPAPSLWLQLKGPGPSPRASQKKNNKFSVGHSLRIIHIQAICSSTCNGILGRVPCEVEQLCWEVKWIPISINALIFSACNYIRSVMAAWTK